MESLARGTQAFSDAKPILSPSHGWDRHMVVAADDTHAALDFAASKVMNRNRFDWLSWIASGISNFARIAPFPEMHEVFDHIIVLNPRFVGFHLHRGVLLLWARSLTANTGTMTITFPLCGRAPPVLGDSLRLTGDRGISVRRTYMRDRDWDTLGEGVKEVADFLDLKLDHHVRLTPRSGAFNMVSTLRDQKARELDNELEWHDWLWVRFKAKAPLSQDKINAERKAPVTTHAIKGDCGGQDLYEKSETVTATREYQYKNLGKYAKCPDRMPASGPQWDGIDDRVQPRIGNITKEIRLRWVCPTNMISS